MALMLTQSERIMFEIYREEGYDRKFRVVYFTELDEHNKESEINAALAGEHVFDGFILESSKREAKQAIVAMLRRMNDGEHLTPDEIARSLSGFMPAS